MSIDARPIEEYAAGHLPGAVSMPIDELERRLDELPRRRTIVAYCRGPYCVLANNALAVLSRRGRTHRPVSIRELRNKMKTNHPVQRLYTDRASLYQRLFVDFLGWGRELQTFFRRSDYIRPNLKILDAGCGTGIITRTLYQLAREKGYGGIEFHAFDLTQNMLEIFREWITEQEANKIELRQADVLEIGVLPPHWKEYDLIVSSTMLEYLPQNHVKDALTNLKQLLRNGGMLLILITRRNRLTRWLARMWWKTNIYEEREIQTLLRDAGFDRIKFVDFSPRWSKSIMVIEATR